MKNVGLRDTHGLGNMEGVIAAFDNLKLPIGRQFVQDALQYGQIAKGIPCACEKKRRYLHVV